MNGSSLEKPLCEKLQKPLSELHLKQEEYLIWAKSNFRNDQNRMLRLRSKI